MLTLQSGCSTHDEILVPQPYKEPNTTSKRLEVENVARSLKAQQMCSTRDQMKAN